MHLRPFSLNQQPSTCSHFQIRVFFFPSYEYLQFCRRSEYIRYILSSLMLAVSPLISLCLVCSSDLALFGFSLLLFWGLLFFFVISLPNVFMSEQNSLPLNSLEFRVRQRSTFGRLCAPHSWSYLPRFTVCLKKPLWESFTAVGWLWYLSHSSQLQSDTAIQGETFETLRPLSVMEIWLLVKPSCAVVFFENNFFGKASVWLMSLELMPSPLCRAILPTSINLLGIVRGEAEGEAEGEMGEGRGQGRATHRRASCAVCL